MAEIRELTSVEDYNEFMAQDPEKLHILKFGANWCGPCKVLETNIKSLDLGNNTDVLMAEIDVDADETSSIVEDYAIRSIPHTFFFKNNEIQEFVHGAMTTQQLSTKIDAWK